MSRRRIQTESELVELLRASDVRAPEHLHDRVRALVDDHTAGRRAPHAGRGSAGGGLRARLRARPLGALIGGATAAAAAAVAIALASAGGGAAAPTLATASAFTLANPTAAAPAESPTDHRRLVAQVDGVAFPYWEESLGWRSVGARNDRVAGRDVHTVYYADAHGLRIGYAIVGGTPPAPVSGGSVWHHDGTDYRVVQLHGAQAVVWLRGGRLCIVSGRGVGSSTLLHLASWDDRGQAA